MVSSNSSTVILKGSEVHLTAYLMEQVRLSVNGVDKPEVSFP